MPSWKKIILSGSDAALNSLNITTSLTASGLRYPTADNGEDSFIQTNGTGILSFQYVKTIYEEVYNGETTTIAKGTPLYVSGAVGAAAKVFKADAGNPARVPAVYIAADTLTSGSTGRGVTLGLIKGVNTKGYPAGTEIYLGVGGGWTSTRPTGSATVQTLGYVTKEGPGGQGVVLNPGPNSIPNIVSGSVWVGNSSSLPVPVTTSSLRVAFAVSASEASTLDGIDSTGYVQTTGDQTIYDIKTFDSRVLLGVDDSLTGNGKVTFNTIDLLNISNVKASIAGGQIPTDDLGAGYGDLLFLDASDTVLAGLYQNGAGFKLLSGNFIGNLIGTASLATTASYVKNAVSASWAPDTTFPYTGSARITGSLNIEGTTQLGTLGKSTQSPLIFNPDTATYSVFYIKNTTSGLTLGTGANPYTGTDFLRYDGSGNSTLIGTQTISGSTTLFNNAGLLNLRGLDHAYIQWYPDNGTRRAYFGFPSAGSSDIILENEFTNGDIIFKPNGGNIGLNTYSPTAKLHLKSDGSTSGTTALTVDNSSNTNLLTILDNGNIGIGTTTPQANLQVIGSSIFSGSVSITTPYAPGVNLEYNISGSVLFGSTAVSTAYGSLSHGQQTTTNALYSHAEGYNTYTDINGPYSHAEGFSTITRGIGSHAEGTDTYSIGDYSHAEGDGSDSYGVGSHAEGQLTISSGSYSHTQGYKTLTDADYSFAGGIETIANGTGQSVLGKYNIPIQSSESVFIVGGGANTSEQKNIAVFTTASVIISGSIEVTGSIVLNTRSITKTSFDTVTGGTAVNTSCDEPLVQFKTFRSLHVKYSIEDNTGSNYRAGTIVGVADGTGNVQYVETSTPSIGNTSNIYLSIIPTNSNANITLRIDNQSGNDVDITTEYTLL